MYKYPDSLKIVEGKDLPDELLEDYIKYKWPRDQQEYREEKNDCFYITYKNNNGEEQILNVTGSEKWAEWHLNQIKKELAEYPDNLIITNHEVRYGFVPNTPENFAFTFVAGILAYRDEDVDDVEERAFQEAFETEFRREPNESEWKDFDLYNNCGSNDLCYTIYYLLHGIKTDKAWDYYYDEESIEEAADYLKRRGVDIPNKETKEDYQYKTGDEWKCFEDED